MVKEKLTPKAQKFVAMKIRKNIKEGRNKQQATAIAFSQARDAGFKIPKR